MKLYMITLALTVVLAFLELVATMNGYEISDQLFYGTIVVGLVVTFVCFITRDMDPRASDTRTNAQGKQNPWVRR